MIRPGQHICINPASRIWLLLLFLALLAVSLNKGFWGAHGEARRAEVARETLQDGHWLVPTLLGEPFVTKPPLLYWSSAVSMGLFGVSDWAARLPALVATLGSWLAMLSLGRSYARELRKARGPGQADGDLGAVALLGLPLVIGMGLNAETEPLLLCFGLAAVAAVLRLPPRGMPRPRVVRLLPGFFLAAGFLTKGPLGWLFPLFGILAFERGLPVERRRLGRNDVLVILLLQAMLVLPWFILVMARLPEALNTWVGESVARLADADFQVHREAWWYYLPRLTALLPVLLFLDRGVWRDRIGRIPLVWLGLGLLLLSLAASKRTHYLLSLAPAAALLPVAASAAGRWARGRETLLRVLGAALPLLAAAAALVLLTRGGLEATPLVLASAALGAVASVWLWRQSGVTGLQQVAAGLLLALAAGAGGPLRAVDAYRSPRQFYQSCAELTEEPLPLINWRNDRYSTSFYLGRPVPPARSEEDLDRLAPGAAWLLCQAGDLEPLARPHRVRLRHAVHDPFLPSRVRTWLLVRLEQPVATRETDNLTGKGTTP
jgi:4-amino-4-deoxy-L-arabinose transferase-like glycosyltransferase